MYIIPDKTWTQYELSGDEFQINRSNVMEIIYDEWDEIYNGYHFYQNQIRCWNLANRDYSAKTILPFSVYLHQLIKLKEEQNGKTVTNESL